MNSSKPNHHSKAPPLSNIVFGGLGLIRKAAVPVIRTLEVDEQEGEGGRARGTEAERVEVREPGGRYAEFYSTFATENHCKVLNRKLM